MFGAETSAQVQERILHGLIEIARRQPRDGDARVAPVRALFESVPSALAKRVYDRLEPGGSGDDFARYLKQQFPHTRETALAVLRRKIDGSSSPSAGTAPPRQGELGFIEDNPKYIEKAFRSMGLPVWGGPLYFSPDPSFSSTSSRNIVIPRSMINPSNSGAKDVFYLTTVHASQSDAVAESKKWSDITKKSAVGYYSGAGGYIFPTVISATTAPKIVATARAAIAMEAGEQAKGAKELAWSLLWWYVGARYPVRTKPVPDVSAVKNALGAATYGKHLKAVPAIQAAHPELLRLPVDEIIAIRAYTAESSAAMNLALRGGPSNPGVRALIQHAISGLNKLPSFKGKLVRTISLSVPEAAQRFRQGTTLVERAFSSSTLGTGLRAKTGTVGLTIHAIGKAGKDISTIAQYAEREVLFLPGTRFFVEKATRIGDAFIVVLREL